MTEGMEKNPITEAAQAISMLELYVGNITRALKYIYDAGGRLEEGHHLATNIYTEATKAKGELRKIEGMTRDRAPLQELLGYIERAEQYNPNELTERDNRLTDSELELMNILVANIKEDLLGKYSGKNQAGEV